MDLAIIPARTARRGRHLKDIRFTVTAETKNQSNGFERQKVKEVPQ
jgi:hypothetical protein